jgi:GDPmannose 4,6-dehydratase
VTTTVRDFVRMSFAYAGIELAFKGEGKEEKAYVTSCSNASYRIDIGKEVPLLLIANIYSKQFNVLYPPS